MSQASYRVAWAKASSPRESTARASAPSPSNSFRVFAWYRVIFGLLILAVTFSGLLHWGSAMD